MKLTFLKNRLALLLFFLALCFIGLLLVWKTSGSDTYYKTPFENRIIQKQSASDDAAENTGDDEASSRQPETTGFKESDIRKQHGNRFDTY